MNNPSVAYVLEEVNDNIVVSSMDLNLNKSESHNAKITPMTNPNSIPLLAEAAVLAILLVAVFAEVPVVAKRR